jgi:RecA-family ATPase
MTDTAELSAAVTDQIASWKRVFANRANGVDARALLRNAAAELWSVWAIDATVHPEMNGVAHQEIVDALQDMAESAAIPPDDAQTIFAENFKAPGADGDEPKSNGADGESESIPPLSFIDITRDPIPPREWLVHDRIPARNVTLLSGEGAIGKSILLLQLSVATELGRDWIGTLPNQGPVIYLSCEDDDDEVRRRLEEITIHYGVKRSDLKQLHVISLAGKDGVLGRSDRSERICATPLFEQLRREVLSIRPRLIVIDTVADVFAGRENDRSQTRQFITLLRGLAIKTGAAMVLASHPSLTGIASDTGLSGSTAWHNSVRARMYFKTAPEVDDNDLRVLEVKKNNYGPASETIVLRWRNGVYVPEPRAGSLEQLAAEAKIDNLFLDLLRRSTKQGRNVSDKAGTSYSPAIFAQEAEAKKAKVSKKQMAEAMTRLFAAGRIRVLTEGSPTHRRSRLAFADEAAQ